ncbi:Na+/H+ antiporter subunit E [Sphingomonas sp. S1-29]|uniref:Na+/H+ antiporter subunit E n=1 Tax=Sphingomonas sp. S1-29 TaxID=2991074 RepID=UPI00223EC4AC|nr:Na+/H+ antiporter subunit E [Sphingomonas sp. S1-29]UZK68833.1 Na+/H+ antiporter subunit E [Sphingomonas sp. S1-29]
MKLLRKAWAVAILGVSFVWDLVVSSLQVAQIVLSPQIDTHPAIFMVPVEVTKPWAVALFAYFTSLTPGSTCLHVEPDLSRLYVHVLDGRDPDRRIGRFKTLYERHILELER